MSETALPHPQKVSHLCIVAPFYNEQENVHIFYETLRTTLTQLAVTYHLVFVDDGSKDNTLLYLNQVADSDPRVTVLSLTRNFGHQIAITAGLDYAQGDAVVVMDSDLQHPPTVIPEMLVQFEQGAEVVYAQRQNTEDIGLGKTLSSGIFYWVFQKLVKIEINPSAPDFRLMSGRVVYNLRRMRETHRFLRGMVPWLGFHSATVYYRQPKRYAGQSKYTWLKMTRFALTGIFSFSTIPLDFIIWLGLIFIGLGFIYLVYILGRFILIGDLIRGWPSLIITVLVLSGVQLLSMGIMARYISMIFEEAKGRPLYVLKQERVGDTSKIL